MRTSRLFAIACCSVIAVAGCGGSSKSAATATTSTTATADTTASTASTATTVSSASSSSGGCDDTASVVKAHLNRPEVKSVDIIGGCSQVAISTTLSNTDIGPANDICTAAAEVAYNGKSSSVLVESATNKELAIGLKESPCIGEP